MTSGKTSNYRHNLTIGHCNIQGGLTGIGKTTEISHLIRQYDLDILSLNETNLKKGRGYDYLQTISCRFRVIIRDFVAQINLKCLK